MLLDTTTTPRFLLIIKRTIYSKTHMLVIKVKLYFLDVQLFKYCLNLLKTCDSELKPARITNRKTNDPLNEDVINNIVFTRY